MFGNAGDAIEADDNVKGKKPHLLAVVYTDHLAVKNANVELRKDGVDVGPGKPNVEIPIVAAGKRSPHTVKTRYLWHDIVSGEGWFVEAKFHKSGGGLVDIPRAKVSHKGSGNYWNKVDIDVTGLEEASGNITVKVHVVDRMRGGLAAPSGSNMTCVCTRAWWSNQRDSKQACTIIHEVGHKVYMVSDGSGKLPDKTITHYAASGHVGNHCHKGCPAGESDYGTNEHLGNSTCVMFGTVNEKNAFCSNCEKAVKKVDITDGW